MFGMMNASCYLQPLSQHLPAEGNGLRCLGVCQPLRLFEASQGLRQPASASQRHTFVVPRIRIARVDLQSLIITR
jgi:hypothetical protein